MAKTLEDYLLEAQGKNPEQLPLDNPYREIGFDRGKKRLGWLRVIPYSVIEERLKSLESILSDKESFIFIGMGGSINGIKALTSLFCDHSLYTLDSLDPQALSEILNKIGDLKRSLVIPISKSGTTKETQLLSFTLKEAFGPTYQDHFLWLSDPVSFEKLNSLGWAKAQKIPIQLDGETDIGGRFSCPHTLIFLLPLFLLLQKDFNKLKEIYQAYLALLPEIRKKAYDYSVQYKDNAPAHFHPLIEGEARQAFSSWVIQLFQESLGSKDEALAVKTLGCLDEGRDDFLPLRLDLAIEDPITSLIAQMYFFQIFLAYYAALKKVSFVTQDFVEKYKDQMQKLEGRPLTEVPSIELDSLITEVRRKIKKDSQFIEVVLYFYPQSKAVAAIRNKFREAFVNKGIFVFIGSDWNHHSYEAAFRDKFTFYVFLLPSSYRVKIPLIPKSILQKNVDTLKLISQATYLTLKEKALLFSLCQ